MTCHYRYHGISAEGDDSEAAEHNAHQVEENTQLARLGPPLRKLTRWSGVKTWRAQINETLIQNHESQTGRWILDIYPLVERLDYVFDVVKKHRAEV